MNALILAGLLAAQSNCPGGVCPVPTYRWKEADNCEVHLYLGETCVGGFDGTVYRRWTGRGWSEPCPCPVGLPRLESKPPDVGHKFGADYSKIKTAPAYSMGGVAISQATAHGEAGGGGALADDSGKPLVIVRTDDPKLQREILDGLAPVAESARISCYPPGHWALKRAKADDGLLVAVRTPDGQDELHRQDDFAGGVPAMLAAVTAAIPGPDLRKSADPAATLKQWLTYPLTVGGYTFPVYAALLAVGAVVYLVRRNRK